MIDIKIWAVVENWYGQASKFCPWLHTSGFNSYNLSSINRMATIVPSVLSSWPPAR